MKINEIKCLIRNIIKEGDQKKNKTSLDDFIKKEVLTQSKQDDKKQQMVDYLQDEFSTNDHKFIQQAIYWFCNDYYTNVNSEYFLILQTLKFRPKNNITHMSINLSNNVLIKMYKTLEDKYEKK